MFISRLRISGFRGVRKADIHLGQKAVFVGPNGCGKSTLVDALSLVLGKQRMVRALTEHDFTGSSPEAATRIQIVVTVSGFSANDSEKHDDWFRDDRAVPKWLDADGLEHASPGAGRRLCANVGFAARFDLEDLEVVTKRYFHDDDSLSDPFDEDAIQEAPGSLLQGVGYFVLPARRTWDAVASFNSDLFRRTISNAADIPAEEILKQRDALREPSERLEDSAKMKTLVDGLNDRLARLVAGAPKFQLRVTAGDSDAVLQALLPHYSSEIGPTLPAARHGTGLVSLQSILLLLEVGRARKAKGLPFVLALEEPELHLAPGIQARLVAEALALADQVICTTHDPEVARIFDATTTFVVTRDPGTLSAEPLLKAALAATATNRERKLYIQNRAAVARALMYPHVLVPEGRFDAEWLGRLARVADPVASSLPPSGAVFGVVPTEDAAVAFTSEAMLRVRGRVVALVDGDAAGDGYVKELLALSPPPGVVIQWASSWTIEDVVIWIIDGGGAETLEEIKAGIPGFGFTTLDELRRLLKTPSSSKAPGLKDNVIAHDAIATAIELSAAARGRAVTVCETLVSAAQGQPAAQAMKDPRSIASTFVREVVELVSTKSYGTPPKGPYKLAWETSFDNACAEYEQRRGLVGLQDADVVRAEQLLQPEGGSLDRAMREWVTRQRRLRGLGSFPCSTVRTELLATAQRLRALTRFGPKRVAMTVHQAKNREFPVVFVLWPREVRTGSPEAPRRLLYNAITRATEQAYLIVHGEESRLSKPPFAPAAQSPDGTEGGTPSASRRRAPRGRR